MGTVLTVLMLTVLMPSVIATTFKVSDGNSPFAALRVQVAAGERVKAEPGSLVSFSGGLDLKVRADSGWFGRMFAGEAPYMTSIEASSEMAGECLLCPREVGDIALIELDAGQSMYLRSGSLLAADSECVVRSEGHASLSKLFFSGTGLRHVRTQE